MKNSSDSKAIQKLKNIWSLESASLMEQDVSMKVDFMQFQSSLFQEVLSLAVLLDF